MMVITPKHAGAVFNVNFNTLSKQFFCASVGEKTLTHKYVCSVIII
jgi:hypothetical protein